MQGDALLVTMIAFRIRHPVEPAEVTRMVCYVKIQKLNTVARA
jgi:hypothetical protein